VLYRMTTRICHAKTIVVPRETSPAAPVANYVRDVRGRVMIPAYAKPAHLALRRKLAEIAAWNESSPLNREVTGSPQLGIIASGVSFVHAREAAPEASVLKLSVTHPLPFEKIARFAQSVERCVVVEEGDPYLAESIRAQGIQVEEKAEMYRFGELNVNRVRRILAGDTSPEPPAKPGKAPQLCEGCSHRMVFDVLRKLDCIVTGDIGCYTLGVLPPFSAMDTCVCMGASLGVGLGLRHTLPPEQARRVVSVIGDSTFVHSGITGLVEMVYNPPPTGHVVIILDNSTTAMTGHQEHPGTGRTLEHEPTHRLSFEDLARALGVKRVRVVDPKPGSTEVEAVIRECLESGELALIVARRPCILIARQIMEWEKCATACEAVEA
jgi:indolepyruvate ferredoxin oxidoreductase, alpha subunit